MHGHVDIKYFYHIYVNLLVLYYCTYCYT